LELVRTRQGESDLVYRKGKWYLLVTCNIDEPAPEDFDAILGVDLGIVNLATDSDGETHSGTQVEQLRIRHQQRRDRLQAVGTRSAKRRLKKNARKQRRFQANINHCIAKHIVTKAKGTQRSIALEDLTGINGVLSKRFRRPSAVGMEIGVSINSGHLSNTKLGRLASWSNWSIRATPAVSAMRAALSISAIGKIRPTSVISSVGILPNLTTMPRVIFVIGLPSISLWCPPSGVRRKSTSFRVG
jgi:hypothetical protein